MADRMIFICWGPPVRGREQHSLEVFNEAVGLFGTMQQNGRIEYFDVVLMRPNGHLDGYMELHGSAEQLGALRESDDFLRITADAALCVDDLRLLDGVTNEGVPREMEIWQGAIAKVPQHA